MAQLGADVTAADIDSRCEPVTLRNARLNDVKVDFRLADDQNAYAIDECFEIIVANLPFSRAELLRDFKNSEYYHSFAAPRGLLSRSVDQALRHLAPGGEFLFSYGSSGWGDEFAAIQERRDITCRTYVQEVTESGCEVRWICGISPCD